MAFPVIGVSTLPRGHPALREPTGWGVHWAGTETEALSGHVDGAVAAGERVADEIEAALRAVKRGEL